MNRYFVPASIIALAPALGQVCPTTLTAASDGAAKDRFGFSLAVDGARAIVGAPLHDGHGHGLDSGAAYVFARAGGAWSFEQELTAGDGEPVDVFGSAVAIDGAVAAVGAPSEDQVTWDAGAVYVFRALGGGWTEEAKLVAPDGEAGDHFGDVLALSGDTLAVAAPLDDELGTDSGSVYLFEDTGGGWALVDHLVPSQGGAGDRFGHALALDGDWLAVGAPDADGAVADAGCVWTFERVGASWIERGRVFAADGEAGELFGRSVALRDERLLVGSPHDDDAAFAAGSAYLYERSGSSWSEAREFHASDATSIDQFGEAVALGVGAVWVGAYRVEDQGLDAGAVYLYEHDGAAWIERPKVLAPGGQAGDELGRRIAAAGGLVVASMTFADPHGTDSGAVLALDRCAIGTRYCTPAVPNSTGMPGIAAAFGSEEIARKDLALAASQLPPNRFAYFLASESAGFVQGPGGSKGNLCLGAPIGRFVKQVTSTGAAGAIEIPVDVDALPPPLPPAIQAGDTWRFQAWFRDVDPTPTSNFTDGVAVTFF